MLQRSEVRAQSAPRQIRGARVRAVGGYARRARGAAVVTPLGPRIVIIRGGVSAGGKMANMARVGSKVARRLPSTGVKAANMATLQDNADTCDTLDICDTFAGWGCQSGGVVLVPWQQRSEMISAHLGWAARRSVSFAAVLR